MLEKEYNQVTCQIIQCAIGEHRCLGPGLMESAYDVCLYKELQNAGLAVIKQSVLPGIYKGQVLNKEFVIDQLIENEIILELKSVENILPVHEAQLLTYLKLSDKKPGLVINFNVTVLKDGIRRKINGNLNYK